MIFLNAGHAHLTDFNVAAYVNNEGTTENLLRNLAGTKPYMAPERIDPQGNPGHYDVRSDVWSFGISMIEVATGKFPYKLWATPFEQLKQVGGLKGTQK